MDVTGTFKLRKVDLVRDGLDANDPIYVRMDADKTYVPLTKELREQINSDVLRF